MLPNKPTIPETVSLLKYITKLNILKKLYFVVFHFQCFFMAIGLQSARSTHIQMCEA